jgi:hypothetical protein
LVEKRSITFGCKTKELDVAGSHKYMFDVEKFCKIFVHEDIGASKSGVACWVRKPSKSFGQKIVKIGVFRSMRLLCANDIVV